MSAAKDGYDSPVTSEDDVADVIALEADAKAARKAAKKAAKLERRAKREGDYAGGQKPCALCEQGVDLLIRCQLSSDKEWKLVCGKCWKTPAVAGGVVDGDGANPYYRYGGLWKNLHRAA